MKYSYNSFLLDFDYRRQASLTIKDEMDKYLKDGLILDLSAGGARIALGENLEIGQKILLVFKLKEELIQKATIVYKDINMLPSKTRYFYGLKFKDINSREREQIMSHVFLLMRKNKIK